MSKQLEIINIVYAIIDTLVCLVAIVSFAWAALYFGKWWIVLFSFIPLLLFSSHTLIVDADIEAEQKGDDNDS